MNFTLLVVVLLTAIAFVGIVIALSNAIAPRTMRRKWSRTNVVFPPAVNHGCSSGWVTTCLPSCF